MKGFSLVELLAVIILLGVIAAIAYPTVINVAESSEELSYEQQITHLERIANTWTSTHLDQVGYDTPYYLQFDELSEAGLIQSKDIINPKTEEVLTGCIEIKWDNAYNQHIITYLESCPV